MAEMTRRHLNQFNHISALAKAVQGGSRKSTLSRCSLVKTGTL
jgi:hypothetical protein